MTPQEAKATMKRIHDRCVKMRKWKKEQEGYNE